MGKVQQKRFNIAPKHWEYANLSLIYAKISLFVVQGNSRNDGVKEVQRLEYMTAVLKTVPTLQISLERTSHQCPSMWQNNRITSDCAVF